MVAHVLTTLAGPFSRIWRQTGRPPGPEAGQPTHGPAGWPGWPMLARLAVASGWLLDRSGGCLTRRAPARPVGSAAGWLEGAGLLRPRCPSTSLALTSARHLSCASCWATRLRRAATSSRSMATSSPASESLLLMATTAEQRCTRWAPLSPHGSDMTSREPDEERCATTRLARRAQWVQPRFQLRTKSGRPVVTAGQSLDGSTLTNPPHGNGEDLSLSLSLTSIPLYIV